MIAFPNSKINLGLHILQKRSDGFHDIETIFYPIALQDGLEIIQNPSPTASIEFTLSGIEIPGNVNENICYKAYHLLKEDFSQLPALKIHLHKVIPAGAGLGGGSANGAFTLLLLNRKFNLGLSEEMLITYAQQLGSDCAFFIRNKACYATGRGEILENIQLDLSSYKIIIVNPGIHINTAWAFSTITPFSDRNSLREIISQPADEWKKILENDFEKPVFSAYSEIRNIKETLYAKGALYASMSGSGSSVYGLFKKDAQIFPDFPSHYFVKHI